MLSAKKGETRNFSASFLIKEAYYGLYSVVDGCAVVVCVVTVDDPASLTSTILSVSFFTMPESICIPFITVLQCVVSAANRDRFPNFLIRRPVALRRCGVHVDAVAARNLRRYRQTNQRLCLTVELGIGVQMDTLIFLPGSWQCPSGIC